MSDTYGPTLRRRQLGLELRRLREAAGKTPQEVAEWLEVSTSTLSKIELGRQAIRGTHVRLLTQLYQVGAPQADALLKLAREASQRGWWAAYGDAVPSWARPYLGLEQDASELWAYENGLVPGLFQTPAYAEVVTAATRPEASPEELAGLAAVRTARQHRLSGERPLRLRVVLDEAVLHRLVGGPVVMREQLEHLAEVARLPQVTVSVLPFSAGAQPSVGSAFTVLWFAETMGMDCIYLENDRSALYLDRPADVDRFAAMFDQLSKAALTTGESLDLIARLAAEL